ncbi:AT-rich interactive domain-containing protein 2-like [Senna tora]|uniref:AT-rich interactive domain-containing protein 2-like n=1 Tax=Senna tora TaxID=362788 RepID=A0A834TRG6_9FABA|nr:AT-rich interactive domain-containing protein 2-like [Senna tora]
MGRALHSDKHKKQIIQENATLPKGSSTRQVKLPSNLFNQEFLIRLKGLALDPCNMESSQDSTQRLQQEMLKIRKSLMLKSDKYPKMKRDLKEFLSEGESSVPFGLSREKSTYQNPFKKRRFQSSLKKEGNNSFPSSIDREKCHFSKQYISLLDSIEFTKMSNQVKEKHLVGGSDDYTQNTKQFLQVKPNIELLDILKTWVILEGQMKTFHSSRANKEDKKHKQAQMYLLSSGGNHSFTRPVIPIGPRFQAEIPKWEGPKRPSIPIGPRSPLFSNKIHALLVYQQQESKRMVMPPPGRPRDWIRHVFQGKGIGFWCDNSDGISRATTTTWFEVVVTATARILV